MLVTPRSLTAAGVEEVPELRPLRDRFELVTPTAGSVPGEEELLALLPGCVGWLAGVERITARVLASATELRAISRNGAGTDAVDLQAAERAGVQVLRAPGANAQGVAELALAHVMSALRHLPATAGALREGRWHRVQGSEIADRTIGIVGLGEVGRRSAAIFTALGARVLGHDPYATAPTVPVAELEDVLRTCDVISLSCPPTPDGRPLITSDRLALVPRGTILVNTARSALVDDDAVLTALEEGRLAAYGVDAFDTEPPEPSALLRHEKVTATPHLGGYTGGSVRRATSTAVDNLLTALASS